MPITNLALHQTLFPDLCPITAAVDELANAGGIEERGAIFTRREVVDFILDLCGYTSDKPLHRRRLLEPSFGDGDFLLPAIDRLIAAWKGAGGGSEPVDDLGGSIRAVELHRDTFSRTHAAVVARLVGAGIGARIAVELADRWLLHGDFLLADLPGFFDLVIGNPPYVRQELIPAVLLAEYRSRYSTIYDRADLYIPFIERSLRSLSPGGALGFICADRWMKNRYGGPLRALVASQFHLKTYVDMTDTPAFHSDVIAYPAITIITREKPGTTRIAHRPEIERAALAELTALFTAKRLRKNCTAVRELADVTAGADPWILDTSDQMSLLRRLEREFPALEDAGCKVGIGVATGADDAYIGLFDELDVEEDRKLPLVMTRDIQTGRVAWRGFGVVNPFIDGPGSGLVDLNDFPRLKRYLEARKEQICRSPRRPEGTGKLVSNDRPHHRVARRESPSSSSLTSRVKPTSSMKRASSTRTTTSTTSRRTRGTCGRCRPSFFRVSPVSSSPATQRRCAAASFGIRRSTCAASACRSGSPSRRKCARSWPLRRGMVTRSVAAPLRRDSTGWDPARYQLWRKRQGNRHDGQHAV